MSGLAMLKSTRCVRVVYSSVVSSVARFFEICIGISLVRTKVSLSSLSGA
jgi:hypothetical protein